MPPHSSHSARGRSTCTVARAGAATRQSPSSTAAVLHDQGARFDGAAQRAARADLDALGAEHVALDAAEDDQRGGAHVPST